jgi:hypothetical protein
MKHRTSAAVCALLAIACCATASALAQSPEDVEASRAPAFTIVGAHVYDGRHWLPAGTQVRVQHGIVLAIGPNVGLARGGTLIDASGKTLAPEAGDAGDAASKMDSTREKCDCSRGLIAPGAHADLKLVKGDASKTWDFSGIIARWRNGVRVGGHMMSSGVPTI